MVWFPGKIIICIFKRDRGLERYVGNYLLLRPGRMRCLSMTWADGHIQRSAACFQLLLFCLCHVKHTWQDFIFGIMYSMWLENQNSIRHENVFVLSWVVWCYNSEFEMSVFEGFTSYIFLPNVAPYSCSLIHFDLCKSDILKHHLMLGYIGPALCR